MSVRSRALATCAALAATAALLVAPSIASAAGVVIDVQTTGDMAIQVSDAGVDNQITVTGTGGTYTVTDALNPLGVGTGCALTASPNTVTCTTTGRTFSGSSQQGNDLIDVSATDLRLGWSHSGVGPLVAKCSATARCNVSGSTGDDTFTGSAGWDTLIPSDGNDTVNGGAGDDYIVDGRGNDTVNGGDGDDQLVWSEGNDVVDGGNGYDSYGAYTATSGVTITLDDAANDGVPGETDNVKSTIESITATQFDDVLWGSNSANVFDAGYGNDELHGLGGNDLIYGGGGDDRLYGEAGSDRLFGHQGADLIHGGPGFDRTSYEYSTWNVMFATKHPKLSLPESRNPTLTTGVVVSLDGDANDGAPGEHDNVQVEGVTGTDNDDLLIGNDQDNDLDGQGGEDRLFGKGGSDLLSGGDDDDRLVGGTDTDELRGEAGDDVLVARDRRGDILNCGIGADRATTDARGVDTVWRTCERLTRPVTR